MNNPGDLLAGFARSLTLSRKPEGRRIYSDNSFDEYEYDSYDEEETDFEDEAALNNFDILRLLGGERGGSVGRVKPTFEAGNALTHPAGLAGNLRSTLGCGAAATVHGGCGKLAL